MDRWGIVVLCESHDERWKPIIEPQQGPTNMATNKDSSWLTGAQVNERYSISPMTRYRWERNPGLDFPTAMKINRRKFWQLALLEGWERGRTSAAA
jgi:hypothetical protein